MHMNPRDYEESSYGLDSYFANELILIAYFKF